MCQEQYETFYWKTIFITIKDNFVGSTDLLDEDGNTAGKLLLSAQGNYSNGTLALNEEFTFSFDNGSMNFTIGYNSLSFDKIRDGNYGVVSNKSGVYANTDDITYYFEFNKTQNIWKITFKFENKK